jgi:CheY-like chemotaxis protein
MTVSEIHILVADDQRNVRGNLKMILEAAGYRVDATGDSEEVLARCHGPHYDIAFIDINMTKIGGLDLVRCIPGVEQKNHGGNAEPVWSHNQSRRSHEARRHRLRRKTYRCQESSVAL